MGLYKYDAEYEKRAGYFVGKRVMTPDGEGWVRRLDRSGRPQVQLVDKSKYDFDPCYDIKELRSIPD